MLPASCGPRSSLVAVGGSSSTGWAPTRPTASPRPRTTGRTSSGSAPW